MNRPSPCRQLHLLSLTKWNVKCNMCVMHISSLNKHNLKEVEDTSTDKDGVANQGKQNSMMRSAAAE